MRLDPEDPRYVDPKGEHATISVSGTIFLKPVSSTKTRCLMMVTTREEKMKYVPNWLLNMVLNVMTPRSFASMNELCVVARKIKENKEKDEKQLIKTFSKASVKVCSIVASRIEKNPALYVEFLGKRVDRLLRKEMS